MASGLTWQVTGLWHPDDDSFDDLDYYGQISDPAQGQVVIPLNDSRRASVVVTDEDPIIDALWDSTDRRWLTHSRMLKVYYRDRLVFWGPINLISSEMASGAVTVSAMDQSIRLIHHYLRRGDLNSELGADTHDRATVSVDYVGLRLLRDAGFNTAEQTTRDVPDLGIDDGTASTAHPDVLMGVSRGDNVWTTMLELANHDDGPDFELEPIDDDLGFYCQLNTYDSQGSDVSDTVAFHYGTGKSNLDGVNFTVGGEYITHAVVLTRDLVIRRIIANADSSAETGPYVLWNTADFDARPAFDGGDVSPWQRTIDALDSYGQGVIKAYGRPLLEVTLDVPVEDDDDANSYVYGTDYAVGDVVDVAGRSGRVNLDASNYRITQVILNQDEATNGVKPELTVVAARVAFLGDDTGDEEA